MTDKLCFVDSAELYAMQRLAIT